MGLIFPILAMPAPHVFKSAQSMTKAQKGEFSHGKPHIPPFLDLKNRLAQEILHGNHEKICVLEKIDFFTAFLPKNPFFSIFTLTKW